MANKQVLMRWPEEGLGTVQSLSRVTEPRKAYESYQVGERVESRCPGFEGKHPGAVKTPLEALLGEPDFVDKATRFTKSTASQPSAGTAGTDSRTTTIR
ncbi:hypothetical protein KUCAC02_029572 [Chaenocephalus aceratus]|nr:hypothetical protein KUCAC02_029572 [Chaenocephalus aceratus]